MLTQANGPKNHVKNRTHEGDARQILKLINTLLNPGVVALQCFRPYSHQYETIRNLVEANQPITMVLPAFPAKSPNPEKTLGNGPDYGEVLALAKLQEVCNSIASIYSPGANVIICSDGRVFSDLVQVTDGDVNQYRDDLKALIESFGFNSLSTFNLEDCFPDQSFDQMRRTLDDQHSESLDEVRRGVKFEAASRFLFNGIHRFITEDYIAVQKNISRNHLRKLAKVVTYKVIQRSHAWSSLVATKFPQALRLSIHPQVGPSKKLGVQLVESPNMWRTPWHAAVLSDGKRHVLVRRREAEAMQAKLTWFAGKYPYFHVDDVTQALESRIK